MRVPRPDLDTALAALTPRERQIVDYVAAGRPNKVIAIDLGISLRTAEAHRARIFAKLETRNAMQLACRLCAHGRSGASPLVEAAKRHDAGQVAAAVRQGGVAADRQALAGNALHADFPIDPSPLGCSPTDSVGPLPAASPAYPAVLFESAGTGRVLHEPGPEYGGRSDTPDVPDEGHADSRGVQAATEASDVPEASDTLDVSHATDNPDALDASDTSNAVND
ncbi:helix-turn-helix transcriptional regulator [Achromobacter sp.]|uniref:response regulator transcription factor n=1 Tax=Achromobacter sp. TaxID=134375 RepID=UPI002579A663|nr:helix-turn-helix transcriptional regulator [Achromobacter sp.]